MTANGWLQFALYSLVLLATIRPVGAYMARVFEGERTWLDPVLKPIERLIYKLSGVNAAEEMNWREYAFAMLGLSAVTLLVTYAIERLQAHLPWNPQGLAAVFHARSGPTPCNPWGFQGSTCCKRSIA